MFLILLFLFLVLPKSCLAASEFRVTQNITYNVSPSGNSHVVQETDLINNFSQIYAKEYKSILIGSSLSDITAVDKTGNILDKIQKQNDITEVNLKFNQPVLGKDQVTHFTTTYNINKLAVNKGNTWEITLPEMKNIQEQDSVNFTLIVPSKFGTLSYSSILNPNVVYGTDTLITLTKGNINNKKILFVFGNNHLFDFNLTYILFNDSSDHVSTDIALPPDTNSQKIIFSKIAPQPENVTIDPDGNWLATYYLYPHQNLEISVLGQAKIHSILSDTQPQPGVNLLKPDKYWPADDSNIKEISRRLSTPKQIYDYVVNTLNYSYGSINSAKRKGALEALVSPENSLCTEFSDLFVTLARAKGIPARELEGFAYTNNPKIKPVNQNADILHAWPQYYSTAKKTWISVDPTWEKTTNGIDFFNDLDLNHFAFVIHGDKSDYPAPAGSYKNNQQIKTVEVKFATQDLEAPIRAPEIEVLRTSFNKSLEIKIKNKNLVSLNNISIQLPKKNWAYQIPILPPAGTVTVNIRPLPFFVSLLPQNQKLNFSLTYNDSSNPVYQSAVYYPHYLNLGISAFALITLLSLSGIIITAKRKPKPYEKNS